ncbi:hypothetical protein BG004_008378 [Podila humilis]|nr:hypothetical protein BG004_008378 [Podila humilis]
MQQLSDPSTPQPESSQPTAASATIENNARGGGIYDQRRLRTIEWLVIWRIYLYFNLMSKPESEMLRSLIEPTRLQKRRQDPKSKTADVELP